MKYSVLCCPPQEQTALLDEGLASVVSELATHKVQLSSLVTCERKNERKTEAFRKGKGKTL
jgi:hypothetical protein